MINQFTNTSTRRRIIACMTTLPSGVQVPDEPPNFPPNLPGANLTSDRRCIRCGRVELPDDDPRTPILPSHMLTTFAPGNRLKCVLCDKEYAENRHDYQKQYHRARQAAFRRLRDLHPNTYRKLLQEEKDRLEREENSTVISQEDFASAFPSSVTQ